MMGFRKTNVCNGKNGGLLTCQALRENPCVPPFINDLEMIISPELGALGVGCFLRKLVRSPQERGPSNATKRIVQSLVS
jgi:hypothetical protein